MTWPNENPRRTRIQRVEFMVELAEEAKVRRWKHVKPYPEDEELRRAVVENPDDDAPRRAYATWMLAQDNENAKRIGAFAVGAGAVLNVPTAKLAVDSCRNA